MSPPSWHGIELEVSVTFGRSQSDNYLAVLPVNSDSKTCYELPKASKLLQPVLQQL